MLCKVQGVRRPDLQRSMARVWKVAWEGPSHGPILPKLLGTPHLGSDEMSSIVVVPIVPAHPIWGNRSLAGSEYEPASLLGSAKLR